MTFNPFQKILIGFAFSPNLKANVFEAMRLGCFFDAGLLFLHVGEKTQDKEAQIADLIAASPTKPKSVTILWKTGAPIKTITEVCASENIDLLLLGALKRENVVKYYMGSIARKLTRKAPCAVLLMLHPAVERVPCQHIVVNGLENPQTPYTISGAFYIAKALEAKKITLVEEIKESEIAVIADDRSLRKATLQKERINQREQRRLRDIVKEIPKAQKEAVQWHIQSIFGRRGYSIGHYARLLRADLLVMNSEEHSSFLNRFFPKDLEHILMELPTNVLIIKPRQNG